MREGVRRLADVTGLAGDGAIAERTNAVDVERLEIAIGQSWVDSPLFSKAVRIESISAT